MVINIEAALKGNIILEHNKLSSVTKCCSSIMFQRCCLFVILLCRFAASSPLSADMHDGEINHQMTAGQHLDNLMDSPEDLALLAAGVDEAAETVFAGVTIIVPVALIVPQVPVSGIL